MRALIAKEFRSFFSSLMGYVVVAAFLMLMGLFLWVFPGNWNLLDGGMATLDPLFDWAPWVFMFLVPAITMRSFAEERRSGTLELLLTRPLSEGAVVWAKFFGAWSVLIAALLPTAAYVLVIGALGSPAWNLDLGATLGSALGLVLLGGAFVAIGLLLSALTTNPLVAFLNAVLASVVMYIGFTAMGTFDLLGSWDHAFSRLGMEAHFRSLGRGLIELEDVGYFAALIAISLAGAQWALRARLERPSIDGVRFLLTAATVAVAWWGLSVLDLRFDWTAERRHSLTEATSEFLEGLEDEVLVTCYLTGEFPATWRRLERAIADKLEEFASASDGQVRYRFEDIYAIDDAQTIGQNEQTLYDRGLRFTRIAFQEQGVKAFKTVWPAAVLHYKGEDIPIQFFKSDTPEPTESMMQGSINAIEYELVTALRRAARQERPQIAFLEGHGELNELEVADLTRSLEVDYDVTRVRLEGKLHVLSEKLDGMTHRRNRFDLLVVAKPDSTIPSKDQLLIDQFVMNGGKVLWLIDPIHTDLDSLRENQVTHGITRDLGVYDLLFTYGARLNRNLVIDPQCAPIMLDAGPNGNQRQYEMFSWYFAPIALPQGISHPITTNLDPIHFDFVSRVDPVGGEGDVRKTVLLSSSERSREYKAPVRVASSIVELPPDYFNENSMGRQPFALLLEGEFQSAFSDRIPEVLRSDADFAFRERSTRTAQVVVGDGDLARNKVVVDAQGRPQIVPLGYDRYAQRVVYDNKEFLLNVISYLLDESAAISVRSRTIDLRPLDVEKIRTGRTTWQALAVGLPLLLVMALGRLFTALRQRKYGKQHAS